MAQTGPKHAKMSLGRFSPALILQELAKLAEPSVSLHMRFQRGLHPFYPAALKLQQPRMQPGMLGALTSHPLLLIRHWAPFMPMGQLLQLLRDFLQVLACHARCLSCLRLELPQLRMHSDMLGALTSHPLLLKRHQAPFMPLRPAKGCSCCETCYKRSSAACLTASYWCPALHARQADRPTCCGQCVTGRPTNMASGPGCLRHAAFCARDGHVEGRVEQGAALFPTCHFWSRTWRAWRCSATAYTSTGCLNDGIHRLHAARTLLSQLSVAGTRKSGAECSAASQHTCLWSRTWRAWRCSRACTPTSMSSAVCCRNKAERSTTRCL